MRRTIRVIAGVLLAAALATGVQAEEKPAPSPLIGKWEGKSNLNELPIAYEFKADGNLVIYQEGKAFELPKDPHTGQPTATIKYDGQVTTTPGTLDVIFSMPPKPEHRLKYLVELSGDTLKMAGNKGHLGTIRPDKMSDAAETFTLKKAK